MTELTISSAADIGPLEVAVYPPDADAIEFALSSGAYEKHLEVGPGRYGVVARRPNGERLRDVVTIENTPVTVYLAQKIGPSPNEFMQAETLRGLVAIDTRRTAGESGWRASLKGSVGAAISNAALSDLLRDVVPQQIANVDFGAPLDAVRRAQTSQSLQLRLWKLDANGWRSLDSTEAVGVAAPWIEVSGDFVKVALSPAGALLVVGLMDGAGFGPLVNVLPVADRVDVTFLSKGLLVRAADRYRTPNGQRVPVALTTLSNPAAADLLLALAPPTTPPADDLWTQIIDELTQGQSKGQSADAALDMLWHKFERPAEAILGAHFLLRFLPAKLPVKWADNLVRALPLAADGPVIAAWARLLNPPEDEDEATIDAAIERNLRLASTRSLVLFARTRALFDEGIRLASPETAAEGRAGHAPYRRFGADAGGLESFWGVGPAEPGGGAPADVRAPEPNLGTFILKGGLFARSADGMLDPPPLAAA